MTLLTEAFVFLAAAVVLVPLFKRLRLGAVLGFLAAGLVIGPWGLRLVTEVEGTMDFAELGVVLLLFIIGLELQPSRLWVLRKAVFGLGAFQVGATALVIGAAAYAFGLGLAAAVVVGVVLSMNSTPFVLQLLAERGQLTTRHGRSAFAISLFQDMAVIPLLAVIPLMMAGESLETGNPLTSVFEAFGMIGLVIVGGRHLLRPVLRLVAKAQIQEIFTGCALLVVIGTALLMTSVGLSMTLGAFLAGVLLADSEYRHEIEASIEPFKGLLLGLFFISVGMSANLGLLVSHPVAVVGAALALMLVKALILIPVGRLSGDSRDGTRSLAVLLCHAGEFAFVLFNVALANRVLPRDTVEFLVVVVTVSMALTPALYLLNEALMARSRARRPARAFDSIPEGEHPRVIIAGFGRVGQIVGRVLNARHIPFTALDISADQIESVRRFGRQAYFGDASKLDLLRAAHTEEAELFVLAIDDVAGSVRTAEMVRKHFPHVTIHARARNRFHAHKLMDLGIKPIIRETYASSLEMAEGLLGALGFAAADARNTIERFRRHDEETLVRQYAVHTDEAKLIQTSKEAAAELDGVFDSDRDPASENTVPMSAADLARSWK